VPAARPLTDAPVAPLLHENDLLPEPPDADTVMLPLLIPWHEILFAIPVIVIADGAVIVNACDFVQALASVAVTVYVPAARFDMVAPVEPLLHINVLLPVPPVALAVIDPFVPALHDGLVEVAVTAIAEGAVTVALCSFAQPCALVTVTEKVPAPILLRF